MGINFYYNGTHSLAEYPSTDAVATNAPARLNYVKNGTTYCAVASTTNATNAPICTIGNLQYLGDCSSPTVHFVKNGTTYHCAKGVSSRTVDIPAGTYGVEDFGNKMKQFVSEGSSRQLVNPVSYSINGRNDSGGSYAIRKTQFAVATVMHGRSNPPYYFAESASGIDFSNDTKQTFSDFADFIQNVIIISNTPGESSNIVHTRLDYTVTINNDIIFI